MPYPGRLSPPNGPGLYRTPAFIMLLAALCGLLPARPSLCSLKALRSMVDGAMMWLFPVGRAHIIQLRHPVLGAPASLIKGRSSSPIRLWPFALSRSYAAIIAAPLLGKREEGWGFAARLRPFIVLCPAPMP